MATHLPKKGKLPRVPVPKPTRIMKSPEERRINRATEKAALRRGVVKVW